MGKMTRLEALKELAAKVEAGTPPKFSVFNRHDETWSVIAPHCRGASNAYFGSLDAALALHEAVLPGWGWRVCQCYLSDDAAVFPDFNCPKHGERLKRELDQTIDWFGLTDVDQRPAGKPARAWLLAILRALIAQEEQ